MTYFTDIHITKFHCRLQKRTMDDVDEWRSFAMWAHTTRAYSEQNRWTYGEYMLTHSPYMKAQSSEKWDRPFLRSFQRQAIYVFALKHKYADERNTSTT